MKLNQKQNQKTNTKEEAHRKATWVDVFFRHGVKICGFAVVLILGGIALLRAKREDIPEVFASIFSSDAFYWVGWVVALLILIISLVLGYLMLKFYPKELERVCKERDRLQGLLIGKPVQHSGNRRE